VVELLDCLTQSETVVFSSTQSKNLCSLPGQANGWTAVLAGGKKMKVYQPGKDDRRLSSPLFFHPGTP